MFSRRSEWSIASRIHSGLLSTQRLSPSRRLANFVASTTSSRRPEMALPTSSSLWPGPYMSAVSRKVTPSSSARWIVAIDSSSSVSP